MGNRSARVGLGALVVSVLGALLLPGPPAGAVVLPPRVDEVDVKARNWKPERDPAQGDTVEARWSTTVDPSMDIDMVGVVVPQGAEVPESVEIRTSEDGRTWGPWLRADFESDHGPDPGTRESNGQRMGTDPIYVGESGYVQIGADVPPDELTVVGVDSDASTASISDRVSAWLGAMFHPAPARGLEGIVTRAGWGADESLRQCSPSYGSVEMAFVHHTENTNTYSQAEAPAIVRGIYAYHVTGRGWCDIGYNFLVDRFGTVYEGRYGGIDRAVVGAQTGGFNSGSTGVAVIGDFTSSAVPGVVIGSLQRVLGWKLGVHGVYPVGQTTLVSAGNDKYPAGTAVTFRVVSGHRDGKYTSCPGDYLYALLDSIAVGSLAYWVTPGIMPYGTFPGGSYVALADRAGSDAWIVSGAGRGGGPHVRVQQKNGTAVADFYAYHPLFTGGVRVAAADFDGDGTEDIVTAPGPGGSPHIRVLSLAGGLHEIAGFYAYAADFRGGVNVGAGDVDGDGFAEVITGADTGGGPHVRALSLRGGLHEVAGFFAYTPSFLGGVRVGAADVDGDGRDEVVTGAGPGGGPHVRLLSVDGGLREVAGFFSYSGSFSGGVHLGAGDIDGDGRDEVVTVPDSGGGPHVRAFGAHAGVTVESEWMALDPGADFGLRVAGGNVVAGGPEELAISIGPGPPARVILRTGTNRPVN